MGIRGLAGWIQWTCGKQPQPAWDGLKGKTIGVDILGFLYRCKAHKQSPFVFLARFIAACRAVDITPVFVFDGKPPEAKRAALQQRSEARTAALSMLRDTSVSAVESALLTMSLTAAQLTADERDLCKQFLYACGVLSLNASGEADDVLAFLSRRGDFAAVVSHDMDLLARGVESLLVPAPYALPGDEDGWTAYSLSHILATAHISYNAFVELCVLMGCDYTVGHVSLPYRAAYSEIVERPGGLAEALVSLGVADRGRYFDAVARLKGGEETVTTLMGSKQWDKWAEQAPPCEPEVLAVFRATVLRWLEPDAYAALSHTCADAVDHPDGGKGGELGRVEGRCAHDHPESAYR